MNFGRAQKILFPLLLPLSWLYRLIMTFRAAAFAWGVFRSRKVGIPVVGVGNITCGGSGKTPVARYLCEFLQTMGRHPAIVSRGYRGSADARVNLVSDGREIKLSVAEAGDEPLMLARSLPGVPVITSRRRYDGADFAANELSADMIVLDDGFQHLALARDLDLVLFAAGTLLGSGHLLPAGSLREGEGALCRAHAFIITGAGERSDAVDAFKTRLKTGFPGRPVFLFGLELDGFVDVGEDGVETITPGMAVFGFCGLADPAGFKQTLFDAGLRVVGFRSFADHHQYTPGDIENLGGEAERLGARALITTEKDMVKIRELISVNRDAATCAIPVYALRVKVSPDPAFAPFIRAHLGLPLSP